MVDTAYSNPGGTGDRTADITVTSNMFGAGDPNLLVDGDVAANPGLTMIPGQSDGYIKFDFGSGADPIIDAFRYYIRTHVHSLSMGVWEFDGSNDDSTWVNLSTAGPAALWFFTAGEEYAVACIEIAGFQNATGYRYIRMIQIKSVVPPSAPELIEFEFRINSSEAIPDPPPPAPPTPDYGEPGGTGDRTALIWVSQNFTEKSGNGFARNLINGSTGADNANGYKYEETLNQIHAEIIFDFRPLGFKQRIVGFKWYQDAIEDQGLWNFEASDVAASGWTALATGLAIGEGTSTEYTFTNAAGYRFYRLRKTDADVILTDNAWQTEIEFIIGAMDAITDPLAEYDTSDRTGFITATLVDANFTIQPDETAANGAWFDGDTAANVAWLNAGTEGSLIFQFNSPVAVNEMRWYMSGATDEGQWRAYGSNDGMSYQALGSAPIRVMQAELSALGIFAGFGGNQKPFLFYKLDLLEGGTSFSFHLREIQFRGIAANPDPGDICLSYSNTLGSGDRISSVTPSLDAGTTTGGGSNTFDSIVDGVRDGTNPYLELSDSNWALKFDLGSARLIKQASLFYQIGAMGTGTIAVWEGSNNDSTWVAVSGALQLDDEIFNDAGDGFFHVVMSLEDNDQFFRYYRLRRTGGSGTFKFMEMEFWIDGATAGEPRGTYKYIQSSGDRTAGPPAGIASNLTGTLASGTIDNLVDGTAAENSTYGCLFTGGQTGVIIKWDFGQRVFIKATRMNAFVTSTDFHGQHYFEGSNDDFASDINVVQDPWHGGIGFGGLSEQLLDTPGAYRYYRLRQKSGAWQNSIYVNEFYFRMFPQLSSGACAGDPPPVINPVGNFTDESEFDYDPTPPYSADFTDSSEFDGVMEEPAGDFSGDFTDSSELDGTPTLTSPPINPVVNFSDEDGLYAREESEPVTVVQSLIIISGR